MLREGQSLLGHSPERRGGLNGSQTRSIEAGKSAAHCGIAQAYHRLGRNDEAIDEYNKAIAILGTDPNAYIGRGDARVALEQTDQALADYNEAVRLGPGFSRAFSSRGMLLADLGQEDGALADYDRAIQLDPGFAHAYSLRGAVLSRRGQNDRALADYRVRGPAPARRSRRIQGPGRGPGPARPVRAGHRRPEQGDRAGSRAGHPRT